ncbi:MAG: AMP-binding protein, partial [Blastocatellia bacterium]
MARAKGHFEPESNLESPYAKRPWLKHYDFWVPATATYPRQAAYRALEIGASNYPDRAATIFFGAEMTFRELKDRAYRLATALHDAGVAKGDRVGIMLPNCPQFLISFFGVLRTSATVVCINPTYTQREFQRLAADCRIKALVVMDQIAPAIVPSIPSTRVELILLTGLQDYMPPAMAESYLLDRAGAIPDLQAISLLAENALRDQSDEAHEERKIRVQSFSKTIESTQLRYFKVEIDAEEDIAALQYTGGTTGSSKGAMLT